jgi:hypothetical protein
MPAEDERIRAAVLRTRILRPPKQTLFTFGRTTIYYYIVTEPVYSDLVPDQETVIREGRVIAEQPKIVTPYYLSQVEGFSSDAVRYFEELIQKYGPAVRGVYYTYKNEPKEMNIVSDSVLQVVEKLNAELDKKADPLTAIIQGEDQLWDVSLMKFIYELTRHSVRGNLAQMGRRGLLDMDRSGLPAEARAGIEELFKQVQAGQRDAGELKQELDRWGVFEEYQDRFYSVLRIRG